MPKSKPHFNYATCNADGWFGEFGGGVPLTLCKKHDPQEPGFLIPKPPITYHKQKNRQPAKNNSPFGTFIGKPFRTLASCPLTTPREKAPPPPKKKKTKKKHVRSKEGRGKPKTTGQNTETEKTPKKNTHKKTTQRKKTPRKHQTTRNRRHWRLIFHLSIAPRSRRRRWCRPGPGGLRLGLAWFEGIPSHQRKWFGAQTVERRRSSRGKSFFFFAQTHGKIGGRVCVGSGFCCCFLLERGELLLPYFLCLWVGGGGVFLLSFLVLRGERGGGGGGENT